MPESDDGEQARPNGPGHIPSGFHPTVSRAQSLQAEKGLGVRATIMPDGLDGEVVVDPSEMAHIPMEELARDGRQVIFDEAGQIDLGPQTACPAYEVREVLGRGGMGVVCLARHSVLKREVALKIARKTSGGTQGTTSAELQMFTNEAYVTADLDHPNVVPIHSLAKDTNGRLFFTMKRVLGISWEHLLDPSMVRDPAEQHKVEQRAARTGLGDHLEILLKVCNALAYAHDKGVIHRDIKPENVMIGAYGEVLLMDWGLAMPFGERNPYALDPELEAKLVGTPAYLAPEMARGKMTRFGPATDVYLLGGTLYHVLTGQPPHCGEGVMAAVNQAAAGNVDPPGQAGPRGVIDPEISRIALKALAARMEDRYQAVWDFQADLREYMAHAEALSISADAARMLAGLQDEIVAGGHAGCDPENPAVKKIDKDTAALAYGRLSECVGSFLQSVKLWSGNDEALGGLFHALVLQVRLAMEQGDLTLARARIELMGVVCKPGVGKDWTLKVRAAREELSRELGQRQKAQDAAARREKVQRLLVLTIIALLACGVAGTVYMVAKQKSLALQNLRATERQHQIAREALRTSEQLKKKIFARSVAGRAALVGQYLQGVEQTVSLYRQEAVALMSLPAGMLPPRPRTPAGRDGFYLDSDYYSPHTRPKDLRFDERYGRPMSVHHTTVKLAPWAMRGPARKRALRATARLARLGRLLSQTHRARDDILWSVVGSAAGVLVSFPGSGRYREKPEYDPTKRSWYLGAIQADDDRPRWVDPHVDAGGLGLLITCVSPIRVRGQNVGVIGAEVSMETLQRMLVEFTRLAGEGARGLLVRADGKVVVDTDYTADPARWKKHFVLSIVDDLGPELAAYYRGALAGQVDPDEAVEVEAKGGPRLFNHAGLGRPDWMLIVAIDRKAILQ